MKINFYLARATSKTQTAVFATASYNGQRVKVYTGERIDPKHWNPKTHSARSSPRFIEAPEFNRRLEKIRSGINGLYLKFKNDHDRQPSADELLKLTGSFFGRSKETKQDLLQYFDTFIQRQATGLRLNPKTGKPIKAEMAKHYRHTLNSLTAYVNHCGKPVDFTSVDLIFYNDYTRYLTESKIALNTIGAHIKRLKTVLGEAAAHGIDVNPSFKSSYFVVQSEEADNIALTENELTAIENLDLSANQRLQSVRDLFLIGCHTGLRYGDYSALRPESISNGYIKIIQSKTSDPVTIPVHPVVERIIEQYGGKLPVAISNQKTNDYLKEICRMVPGLADKSSKKRTRGGVKVVATMSRWEMITTHTARRTFATCQYLNGVPPLTIMHITGHRTERSFLRYIKVSSDEHARKMKDLWADSARQKMKAV